MSNYRKLFLLAHPDLHRTPALDLAANLARRSGAVLHMSLVDHSAAIAAISHFDAAGGAEAREGWLERRRRWLHGEAESLRAHGVAATADVSWAHPALGEILSQIAELGPDLVVKDLRSKSGQALPTALDRHLLGLCPSPLLLVHDAAPALPRRILVAIDPGRADPDSADFNEVILRAAAGMALQSDAELHLMHAMTPLTAMATYPGECVFSAELYDSFVASQRDLFGRYADAHGVPQERRQFVTGPAASAITEAAQRLAADLIVIGSVRRHGIDRLLIGSTTEAVLEQLPCSLLAVRPETANSAPRVLRQVNARRTSGS